MASRNSMAGWVRPVALLGLMGTLSGCANMFGMHYDDVLSSKNHVLAVDAKQRAIFSGPRADPGPDQGTYRMYCSEPPPDALSALSMGASGTLGAKALENKDPNLQLQAALAMSETAATIERTQTVNVLREEMFRTCQNYFNGAIGKDEFIVQAARDERLIVSVLAIEQLTQVARPPSTIIGGGGASASNSSPTELYDLVKRVEADEIKSQQTLDTATANLAAAQADITKAWQACDQGTFDAATRPEPATSADGKTTDTSKPDAYDKCDALLSAIRKATAQHDKDQARLDKLDASLAAQTGGQSASTSNAANALAQAEKIDRPSDTALSNVATQVKDIVEDNFKFDEVEMSCVVRLRGLADEETKALAKQALKTSRADGAGAAGTTPEATSPASAYDQYLLSCLNYVTAETNKRQQTAERDADQARLEAKQILDKLYAGKDVRLKTYLQSKPAADVLAEWAKAYKATGYDGPDATSLDQVIVQFNGMDDGDQDAFLTAKGV